MVRMMDMCDKVTMFLGNSCDQLVSPMMYRTMVVKQQVTPLYNDPQQLHWLSQWFVWAKAFFFVTSGRRYRVFVKPFFKWSLLLLVAQKLHPFFQNVSIFYRYYQKCQKKERKHFSFPSLFAQIYMYVSLSFLFFHSKNVQGKVDKILVSG